MDKSSVQFGMELENYIVQKFQELGINASRTKGSGNQGQISDVNNPYFCVECKNRNVKDIVLKEDVWLKLLNEIPLHSERKPLYILGNKNKKVWAVTDVDTFFELVKGYLENLNGRI